MFGPAAARREPPCVRPARARCRACWHAAMQARGACPAGADRGAHGATRPEGAWRTDLDVACPLLAPHRAGFVRPGRRRCLGQREPSSLSKVQSRSAGNRKAKGFLKSAILQSLEKKMMGRRVTGVKMTSSCLSALVARLRVRGGDRGAARRGWLRPVCGCAAGPVAARGVCAARPGRREHERGPGRQLRREALRGRGRRGWEAWFGTSAAQALLVAGQGEPQARVDVSVCHVHDGGAVPRLRKVPDASVPHPPKFPCQDL